MPILALDQGTTSSRAILFDHDGSIVGVAQQEFTQHYPQPSWVEHDATEIWQSQRDVAQQVVRETGCSAADIAALGITNQRETTVVWDRSSGEPVHHAIVWQDRRTADYCKTLVDDGHADRVRTITGLVIDPYFAATKLRWLLENVPDVRQRAEQGELAFGTIDSWLIWNLTGGRLHVTDVTNASRTMLLDIETCQWSEELLELFQIPPALLPEIRPSCHVFGETVPDLFGGAIKIAGSAGDQQAALFGQNCTSHGMAKNTYGTGCFMLMNVGDQPLRSESKLLTSVACTVDSQTKYALEGSVFIGGAVVQWLRDGLGIIDSAAEIEALAASVPDTAGVYLVPAFAGLGAPYWDAFARGSVIGITRGTTRAHFARAALEGIAFQVADVLDAMEGDSNVAIRELRVDGGAATNDLLMQFQSDILGVPVIRPKVVETTALGAAFLAGLAVGFWQGLDEIEQIWQTDRVFEPTMPADLREHRRRRWRDALDRARNWDRPDE